MTSLKWTTRFTRKFDFDLFGKLAENAFRDLAKHDPRNVDLEKVYALHVLCGGRDGGMDNRIVEIFYGQRPFERVTEVNYQEIGVPKIKKRLLLESGATLLYQRTDNGTVLCTLHPAQTENFTRREEALVLKYISNPSILTGRPLLKRHWTAFMSYMQCSSLEGEPTLADKLRVWWLLVSCKTVVDHKATTARIWIYIARIASFALTVGLSGFLLEVLQLIFIKHKCK